MGTNIESEITRFIESNHSSVYGNAPLTRNTLLLEEKYLDSLGMLELISFVEEKYRIEIPDEDTIPDHFGTIERLVVYIKDRIDGSGSKLYPGD